MMVETIIIPQKLVFHRYPDTDTLLKIHTHTDTGTRWGPVYRDGLKKKRYGIFHYGFGPCHPPPLGKKKHSLKMLYIT